MTNTLNKVMHNGEEYIFPGGIPNSTVGTTSTVSNIWVGADTEYGLITPEEGQISIVYKEEGGGGGWQPGANTLLYIPFTDSYADTQGNTVTLTGATPTYGTTTDGEKYLDMSNNTTAWGANSVALSVDLPTITGSGDWTFSNWLYNDVSFSVVWGFGGQRPKFGLILNNHKIVVFIYGDDINTNVSIDTTRWNNIIFTHTNNDFKVYLNGQQVYSQAKNFVDDTDRLCFFTESLEVKGNNFIGKYDEMIVEDTTWSAIDVDNYYNLTKGKYGIS